MKDLFDTTKRYMQDQFECEDCHALINGLYEGNQTKSLETKPEGPVTLMCGYCGALYMTKVEASVIFKEATTKLEWVRVPDDKVPPHLKPAQDAIRRGQVRRPPGVEKPKGRPRS